MQNSNFVQDSQTPLDRSNKGVVKIPAEKIIDTLCSGEREVGKPPMAEVISFLVGPTSPVLDGNNGAMSMYYIVQTLQNNECLCNFSKIRF